MRKLKIILFFSFLLFLLFIRINQTTYYCENNTILKGALLSYQIDGNQLKAEVFGEERVLVQYYFQTEQEKKRFSEDYHLGDYLEINGCLKKPSNNRNFHLFNYQNYLKSKKINWIIEANQIIILRQNSSFLFKWKETIIDKIEEKRNSHYLKYILLGDSSSIEESFIENARVLGVSHLFAISGMHIHLLVAMIMFIIKRVTSYKWVHFGILICFLTFYCFLTDFSPSIIRASSFFLLLFLKKLLKLSVSSLSLLLLIFIVMLLYNPFYCYHLGFVFSFLISFSLLYFGRYQKPQNYIRQLFQTSWISFWMSLPILISNFYQVNFLTPIWNLFFVPFVSLILFPISVISLFFSFCNPLLEISVQILVATMEFGNQIQILQFSFSHISLLGFLIYYAIIIPILKYYLQGKYKPFLVMLLVLIFHYHINYWNSNYKITMIDVGQGDSILIEFPHAQGNVLIDTGGILQYQQESWKTKKKRYSIGNSILIPYVQSVGIHCLDVLFLTHGDIDHMKEAIVLLEQFCIKKIVMNSGKMNELETILYEKAKQKNIPVIFMSQGKIKVRKETFYLLNEKNSKNENEDSLIIYTKLKNQNILLMGDAGEDAENKLLSNYFLPKMDILKVGHHGSKGGTTSKFLNAIVPKYALISVGVNNRYNHPNLEVINRLSTIGSIIYQTNTYGMVQFILNDKIQLKTRYLAR